MIVLSQQINKVVVMNRYADKDLNIVKQCYMDLFDISTHDTRLWTPAESRSWLEFLGIHHARFGSASFSVLHTFTNLNKGKSLLVIGGDFLSQMYWFCENGDESKVIDL